MKTKENDLKSKVVFALKKQIRLSTVFQNSNALDTEAFAGKMLRTHFAQSIAGHDWENKFPHLVEACTAVELIHSASLFHDDIIDGASIRRGKPALWQLFSPTSAVLLGDILFCEALSVLLTTNNSHLYKLFTEKSKEVCETEARQELFLRGRPCDVETCVAIARGKTGPLFAFAAMACAGNDPKLEKALEEAGYRIGCAYQISDDLVDEYGAENHSGKTLGTDRLRKKFTLAQQDFPEVQKILLQQYQAIPEPLAPWPEFQERIKHYVIEHLLPILPNFALHPEAVAVNG